MAKFPKTLLVHLNGSVRVIKRHKTKSDYFFKEDKKGENLITYDPRSKMVFIDGRQYRSCKSYKKMSNMLARLLSFREDTNTTEDANLSAKEGESQVKQALPYAMAV